MCGITGIYHFHKIEQKEIEQCRAAVEQLKKRGPDNQSVHVKDNICLGHTRLSIIDTSPAANQPFLDSSSRYSLVYNGEIYNYKELRHKLQQAGFEFRTESDTEVLLNWFIHKGTAGFCDLNGFFAFAIYDKLEKELYLVRDRYGIKPLLYYMDDKKVLFASEMKALMQYDLPREIDFSSLNAYLQLNYVPAPHSMLINVKKLEPGCFMHIKNQSEVSIYTYYNIPYPPVLGKYNEISYEKAQIKLVELLDESVQKRLVADVSLGTFLSGGIDSSAITALASRHKSNLSTFSVGYKDEAHFDETKYALKVAKKFKTDHHVFSLDKNDLMQSLFDLLENVDEPFADSSAIAVNTLSAESRKLVKVALSGDGADELFAGYHKHMAEYLLRIKSPVSYIAHGLQPLMPLLPQNRNSKMGNLFRKANRFGKGMKLSDEERYWQWASSMDEADAANLMQKKSNPNNYSRRKFEVLKMLGSEDFNDVLFTDMKLVLQSDMLTKVDSMSMRHGLEVRLPFLDHHLVDFAFSLPVDYKINKQMKKRILQDAFKDILPAELYNRPKQGFEVPLLKWFKTDLMELVEGNLLSDNFIKEQNLFNLNSVKKLKDQLYSSNPADSQYSVWALLVFNSWWKKYIKQS